MEKKISNQKIKPHFWFDKEAEEAANYYASIFKNSGIGRISRYGKEGHEVHGMPEGTVMSIAFQLEGQDFLALNGGPIFTFNESISFAVSCENQEEVDYYWDKLTEGGDKNAQQCGWLKDKFGVSWQVVPSNIEDLLDNKDRQKAGRVMTALLKMKKLDIRTLQEA